MDNNRRKKYLSTSEVAKILGISRIAVFKKIKSGEISAQKIGRNYAIPTKNLHSQIWHKLNNQEKKEIAKAVKQIVKEYGETLRLLGKE
jgi:excisionase family DNA binding protein